MCPQPVELGVPVGLKAIFSVEKRIIVPLSFTLLILSMWLFSHEDAGDFDETLKKPLLSCQRRHLAFALPFSINIWSRKAWRLAGERFCPFMWLKHVLLGLPLWAGR